MTESPKGRPVVAHWGDLEPNQMKLPRRGELNAFLMLNYVLCQQAKKNPAISGRASFFISE
jgi:hypothetical protein